MIGNKQELIADKLHYLEEEFTENMITQDEFKRYLKEWIKLCVELDVQFKDAPISLIDYIRVRYGKL